MFFFIEKLNAKKFFKNILKILKTDDVSALLYVLSNQDGKSSN